jgi:hypothetical protein
MKALIHQAGIKQEQTALIGRPVPVEEVKGESVMHFQFSMSLTPKY